MENLGLALPNDYISGRKKKKMESKQSENLKMKAECLERSKGLTTPLLSSQFCPQHKNSHLQNNI